MTILSSGGRRDARDRIRDDMALRAVPMESSEFHELDCRSLVAPASAFVLDRALDLL